MHTTNYLRLQITDYGEIEGIENEFAKQCAEIGQSIAEAVFQSLNPTFQSVINNQ
jgi:hypothetical protein